MVQVKRRQPNGQPARAPRGEREAEVIELAVHNRRKHWGIKPGLERSQLAGSHFGRLAMAKVISEDQYEAGLRWAKLTRDYMRLIGAAPMTPKAQAIGQLIVSEYAGDIETMTPDVIAGIKSRYDEMHRALIEAREGREYLAALRAVILEDRPGRTGHLREALNLLAHVWR